MVRCPEGHPYLPSRGSVDTLTRRADWGRGAAYDGAGVLAPALTCAMRGRKEGEENEELGGGQRRKVREGWEWGPAYFFICVVP